MRAISKAFAGVLAVDQADLTARGGEAVALMGANGAGKSTLMNILGGVLAADAGSIAIDGEPIHLARPADAAAHGIAFVHQELNVLPTMTVAENIYIDDLPCRGGLIDRAAIWEGSRRLLEELGCRITPDRIVGELGTGDRQMIEIARAMRARPRIVILDEPTSSLTRHEKERLFAVIARLKETGTAIVYITHFLDEIFNICERVVVMRNGRTVAEHPIGEVQPNDVVTYMLGDLEEQARLKPPLAASGTVLLDVEGLTRAPLLQDIGFRLHAGEVLGIWGLLGSGRTELLRALVGLDPIDGGSLRAAGPEGPLAPVSPAGLHRLTGFVTEDRRGEGLLLPLGVDANLALPSLERLVGRFGLVGGKGQASLARSMIERLNIKVSGPRQVAGTLSGGNQQKVVFGRWLATSPRLFFLDEPTRGLDVHAKSEILTLAADVARGGGAVLVVCSELEDLMRIADRYLVMRQGRITAELPGTTDRQTLLESLAADAPNESLAS
jgi:ABC-type sugar transport system ATPase subunit